MKTTASRISSLVLLGMTTSASMAQTQFIRKDLLQVLLTRQTLSQIDIKQVTLPVGQAAPKHIHPCPVVGYVASGSVLFQIEGEEKRVIQQGEAFYEPKDKVILHFDNNSPQEPLTFIAFYLKEADEALIKLVK